MHDTLHKIEHRFVLELACDGKRVHEAPLEREDFHRLIEDATFSALRCGSFTEYAPRFDRATIAPHFVGTGPHITRLEVVLPTPTGEHRVGYDISVFGSLVRQSGTQLALAGRLPGDAQVSYRLAAFADEAGPRAVGGLRFEVESEMPAVPIREGSRRDLGPSEAWDAPRPEDFPVLIPRHVLEEAVALAREQPTREVGGALLGHLRRDPDTNEVYLEVRCLTPCEHTDATALSVTFTHETWARVREVVEWRGEGELIVGWFHSHPFRLCAECPSPVPTECQAKILFYSADDEFLMELTFPRPFMVGLLAAVEPRLESTLGHLPVRLFGWDRGRIVPRGFEVIE